MKEGLDWTGLAGLGLIRTQDSGLRVDGCRPGLGEIEHSPTEGGRVGRWP